MSEFDDLLAQVRSGQVPAPKQPVVTDEYSSLLQQVRQPQSNSIVQSTAYNASLGNPDDAAERKRLADQLKAKANEDWAPTALDPKDAKRRVSLLDSTPVLDNSPALSNRFLTQDFAARTIDDIPQLGHVESTTTKLKNMHLDIPVAGTQYQYDPLGGLRAVLGVLGHAGASIAQGYAGLSGAMNRAQGALLSPILGEDNFLTKMGEEQLGFAQTAGQVGTAAQEFAGAGEGAGYGKRMLFGAGSNVTQVLALGLPMALEKAVAVEAAPAAESILGKLTANFTKANALAVTPMALNVVGQEATTAYEQGMGPYATLGYAGGQGAIEAITEMLPFGLLARDIKMDAPILKILRNQLISENLSEQVATHTQDLLSWSMLPENKDKTFGDYLAERPSAALDTLVQTTIATVLQTSAVKALHDKSVREMSQGQRAVYGEQNLNEVIDAVQATKSHQRNAEDVKDLMDDIGAGDIHIDARTATQILNQSQLQTLVSDQDLQTALQTQGDIVVPASQFAMAVASDESMRPIVEHARVNPDLPSAAEAREVDAKRQEIIKQQGQVSAESEKILADAQTEKAFIDSANQVGNTLIEQLTAIGKFLPGEIRAYVAPIKAFYVTQAKQMNITPGELYSRLPYNVRTGKVEQAGVLNQVSPSFIYHGTSEEAAAAIEANGFDVTKSADGSIWFTSNPSIGEVAASQSGAIVKRAINESDLKLGGWKESDKYSTDQLISMGYDGLKLEDNGEITYQIFNPNKLIKVADTLKQSATIRSGQETLESFGLDPTKKYKTREVAAALERRQRTLYGSIAANDRSTDAIDKIAAWMQAEVEFEMLNPGKSGVGWYSQKFQNALDIMGNAFPELKTDKAARNIMTALIAITSDGQKVVPNFTQAMDFYDSFRQTGKFASTRGHQRQASIDNNIKNLQQLYDSMGPIDLHIYLMQEKPISELKQIAKQQGLKLKSDYQAHIKMPMAAVAFGPKLGAFYANLMGAHGYLTMDRWWSRTFNRYRGTLLTAPTKVGLERFKKLIGKPELSDDEAIAATVEYRDSYEAKNFKRGTEIEKAANTIWKAAFDALEDAPFNAKDRTFMLDAVNKAQQNLAKSGYTLSVADIQAILWYYEKRLYGELGARQTADISYEDAAKRVVAEYAGGLNVPGNAATAQGAGAAAAPAVSPGNEQFQGPSAETLKQTAISGMAGSQQAGDGGGRATSGRIAPLEGVPNVPGFNGPDPRIVQVAEQYAAENGIDLRRQSEYVSVDPERAERIAAAYAAMKHDPQNPKVKEAYQNLINQTIAQYRALEAAGYKFWFIDTSIPSNQEYANSPWNAMRDMRQNQEMGVFPTTEGFGSSDLDVSSNPLLEDTGIKWPVGGVNGPLRPVLANDLFRAVHDAFGHGMEGAGFRAQGEENAWQAHVRLFTGSAIGAITSETRGQNSWLNYGPHGEKNRTASTADTVFADQKTGLMPEWTWTEGRAGDMLEPGQLFQQARGEFSPATLTTFLNFLQGKQRPDMSTFLHETGHFYLEAMFRMAAMPEATESMKAQAQTILDWFGVKDLNAWNSMTLDEQRKHHEAWAYNYELYLYEGKAPSTEMQSIFDKFSVWLKELYQSIRGQLNAAYRQENGEDLPILTGEVRQVMDRLIASDTQISQAEEIRNMKAIFQTQEESGMDDAQWAEYQDLQTQSHESSVSDLTKSTLRQMKWLSNARSKLLKAMQSKVDDVRKGVHAEVTKDVQAQPVYRAIRFLRTGKMEDENGNPIEVQAGNKLNKGMVKAMYPEGALVPGPDMGKLRGMLSDEGLPPDMVAEIFGFTSGDDMIRSIAEAKSLKDAIDDETDARMLREHSELMDPEIQARNVEQALHTEARARFVAVELRHLAKATQPIRVMLQAAKQAAKQIISGKKIKDIKPRDYSLAEARAAKKAEAHMKKGESKQAAQEKQGQLLQGQLAAEAVAARNEIDAALSGFKKLFRPDEKIAKNRDMDLVNAARAILSAFGIGPKDKSPFDFVDQLRAYNPDLYAELEPLMFKAAEGAVDYKQLTMDEFRAMKDAVDALWFNAKRDKQIMVEGQKVELANVISELNDRMTQIGIPSAVAGERKAPTKKDRLVRAFNNTKAILRRVEHWADSLDGEAGPGAFTKYIWRPVKDALNAYRLSRNDYVKRYAEMIQGLDLPVHIIEAPELDYSFGHGNGGIGKAELLGALLHTGNESNFKKLLVGRGWGVIREDGTLDTGRWDAFLARMINEGFLTKQDFDFAQQVWDLNEEIKPMAQQAHHDMFGYYFKEVPNTPFTNKFGSYRGGYVPAKTDPFIVRDAQRQSKMEALESDFRNAMPSTGLGFTKGRVEYNRPLSLDVRQMTNHIDSVIRFALVQPAIKDALKILRNRKFADNLSRLDPSAIEDMLIPWLNRAARQITSEVGKSKFMDDIWRGIRQRTGIAIMFGNLRNALQQLTGYFPSSLKVKPRYLKSALAAYISNTQSVTEDVAELSPFMRDRLQSQIFDIQENMNDILLNPSKFDKLKKWTQQHGYFLQTAFQNQVDVVTWTATYNQTLAELGSDVSDEKARREAVQRADAAVRLTQSSLSAEDLAAFEVGTPFTKTLTHFGGYMNMMANLNVTAFTKIVRDLGWRGNKGKLLYVYLLGIALPALVGDAIMRSLGTGWDDDDEDGYLDEFMAWFFGSQGKMVTGMVPFAGQLTTATYGALTTQQYDDKISISPSITALESAGGTIKAGINLASEDQQLTGKNVRDVMTFLSLVTGVPMTILGRPLSYAVEVNRGEIQPTSAYDLTRGLVTGVPSAESKQ